MKNSGESILRRKSFRYPFVSCVQFEADLVDLVSLTLSFFLSYDSVYLFMLLDQGLILLPMIA